MTNSTDCVTLMFDREVGLLLNQGRELRFGEPAASRERGNQKSAFFAHHAKRFVIDESAVLDRIDSSTDRTFRTLGPVGVGSRFPAQLMSGCDQRVQLGLRELRYIYVIS